MTVHLEGDAPAWRRRLAIIEFRTPKPENIIADLSEQILAKEAAGVLNWMLEGLEKIWTDDWQLRLTEEQQRLVDDLLMESEGETVFAKECIEKDGIECLTIPMFCLHARFDGSFPDFFNGRNRRNVIGGEAVIEQEGENE